MAKDPAFPFYASDWLGSNMRAQMTLEQQGAYVNLLARQWSEATCSLPDDDKVLAKLSEMGEGWFNGGCQLVRDCFPPHPNQTGRIANRRLLELRAERDKWVEKSRIGGLKSAEGKRLRCSKGGTTTVGTKRQPNANTPSPSSSPKKVPPKVPLDKIHYPDGLDTPEVRQAITDWLDYKQARQQAYKRPAEQISRLLRQTWVTSPAIFVSAVDHSIAQNYQGVFPAKDSTHGKQPRPPVGQTGRIHNRTYDDLPETRASDAEPPGGA